METRFELRDPDTNEVVYIIVVYPNGDVKFFAPDGITEVEVSVEELDRLTWAPMLAELENNNPA